MKAGIGESAGAFVLISMAVTRSVAPSSSA